MTIPVTTLSSSIEQTDDQQSISIQATQQRTATAVNNRGAPPNILGPISMPASTAVKINHKLGRIPTEWYVTDVTGNYGVFFRMAWDASTITLRANNTCVIMLRVA